MGGLSCEDGFSGGSLGSAVLMFTGVRLGIGNSPMCLMGSVDSSMFSEGSSSSVTSWSLSLSAGVNQNLVLVLGVGAMGKCGLSGFCGSVSDHQPRPRVLTQATCWLNQVMNQLDWTVRKYQWLLMNSTGLSQSSIGQ